MSLDEAASVLRAHDPDRLGICLMAPSDARPRLVTLYALNLELARAPLASAEPLIAEMRLQWWIERLGEIGAGRVPAHGILGPLAEAWGPRAAALAALAEGRRRDAERLPHAGPGEVGDYVIATAVPLMQFATEALGLPDAARATVSLHAMGVGLVHWLAALPVLQARGMGLARPTPEALAALAARASDALGRAAGQRESVPRGLAPVLYPGPAPRAVLRAAPRGIEALAGGARPSEFRRRLALGRFALTGRWWVAAPGGAGPGRG